MTIVRDIPWTFDEGKFLRAASIDGADDIADEARRLARDAAPLLRPKAVYGDVEVERLGGPDAWDVVIGGVTFNSEILRCNLEGVERVYPYVTTCGAELEGFDIAAYDYLAFYWIDQIKQAALTQASAWVRGRIAENVGSKKLATMNPGSGDADVWPIAQQARLFALLNGATDEIGVTLTDSFLMVPNKTVSGVFFRSDVNYMNCKVCTRENCENRRAPYDATLAHAGVGDEACGTPLGGA